MLLQITVTVIPAAVKQEEAEEIFIFFCPHSSDRIWSAVNCSNCLTRIREQTKDQNRQRNTNTQK